MKYLCIVTAAIELGAGVALLGVPAAAGELLFGEPLTGAAALILARIGGVALISLAVACWFARSETQSRAARGLIAAMLLYNVATSALLAYAGVYLRLHGIALCPGAVLHAAMAAWCMTCLARRSTQRSLENK